MRTSGRRRPGRLRQVDEVEVFGVFGGDLPARIGAVKPEDKTRGRPRGQYSGTIAAGKAGMSGSPASGRPERPHACGFR
ncbi:MAG: hypothetical protein BAA02_12040 [Paenibacillaceae bacterium ZCTH02-B3]|nr:MAG: hypothetical protein BAA02_12040 [Paenibacillaceae bacterium ZCTH02-B3]